MKHPTIKNLGRRTLAFFLAMVMLVPIIPVDAFAADEPAAGHVHTAECPQSKTLICGYPENPAEKQDLLCEVKEHSHADGCYTLNCDGHVHGEACYELTCEEDHAHTEDCRKLVCEESHTHSDDCRSLSCGLAEHTHGDSCYAPAHQHTDACYQVTYTCSNTTPNTPGSQPPSSAPADPNGQTPDTDPVDPNGQTPSTDPVDPNGQTPGTGPVDPNGQTPGTGPVDPNSQTPGTGPVDPNGQTPGTGPVDPNGQTPGTGPVDPNGQTPDTAPVDPSNQVPMVSLVEPQAAILTLDNALLPTNVNTTTNMGALLTFIHVDGLGDPDSDGKFHAEMGQSFSVDMKFREQSNQLEFAMDGSISFPLPAGITVANASGQIEIGVTVDSSYRPIWHNYSINGNKLTITWNKDDDNFSHLAAAHGVDIEFSLSVQFDGTKDQVSFGESSNATVKLDTTGSVTITKNISGLKNDSLLTDEKKAAMTFELRNISGDTVKIVRNFTYQDMANGAITIDNLKPGTYTVVETGHPEFPLYTFDTEQSVTSGGGNLVMQGDRNLNLALKNDYDIDNGDLVLNKEVNWTNWDGTTTIPEGMKDKITFTITGPYGYDETYTYADPQFADGSLTLTDLPVGNYTITETNEITGYTWTYKINNAEAESPSYTTPITKDGESTVSFENTYEQKKGNLAIEKISEGHVVPDDTKFKVTYPDGHIEEFEYKDMTNGKKTFENVPLGTYKVEEIDDTGNVTNYKLDVTGEGKYTLSEENGTTTATITNIYTPLGSLEINKTIAGALNGDNLTPEQKAKIKFEITGPADFGTNGKMTFTYADMENGKKVINNVPAGTYTIKEVGSDITGYTVVTDPVNKQHEVVLTNPEEKGTASFTNTYTKEEFKLKIVKQFADGSDYDLSNLPADILAKTKFKISKDGSVVKECSLADLEEDLEKIVELSGPGNYTIEEVNPDVNGIGIKTEVKIGEEAFTNGDTTTVSIQNGVLSTVTFKNKYTSQGIIKVDKDVVGLFSDEETALRDNLKFNIYKVGETEPYMENVPLRGPGGLENGITVPKGEYRIEEVSDSAQVPGYLPPTVIVKVGENETNQITIVEGSNTTVSFTNSYTRDEEGNGTLSGIKTVSGLNGFGGNLTEDNDFTKEDETSLFDSISFEIQQFRNGQYREYRTCTLAELIDGISLPQGQYRIKETGAVVPGYDLSVTYWNGQTQLTVTDGYAGFEISENGTLSITVNNVYTGYGNLLITKTIEGLSNLTPEQKAERNAITFKVTGPAGFGTNGEMTFTYGQMKGNPKSYTIDHVPLGTYTITEISGEISDYTVTVTPNPATVTDTVTPGSTFTVNFTNTYVHDKGNLTVKKVLAGDFPESLTDDQKRAMKFTVKIGNTTVAGPVSLYDFTYDEETNAYYYTFSDLDTGTYTVEETISDVLLNSYNIVVTSDKEDVTIEKDQTAEITITNTFTKTGSLKLMKTFSGVGLSDEQKNTLFFTVEQILSETEKKLFKTVHYSDFTDGEYTIYNLLPGTYTVTESDDTTGYKRTTTVKVDGKDADSATVGILAGETYTVTFNNHYEEVAKLKLVKNVVITDSEGKPVEISKAQREAIRFDIRPAAPENARPTHTFTLDEIWNDQTKTAEHEVQLPSLGEYIVTETVSDPDGKLFGKYNCKTEYQVQVIDTTTPTEGNMVTLDIAHGKTTVIFTNTYTEIPPLEVRKYSSQTKVGLVEKEGKKYTYPMWRFTLHITNLTPQTTVNGSTSFRDNYDGTHPDWFRLATLDEVKQDDKNATFAYWLESTDGNPVPKVTFDNSTKTITISGVDDTTAQECNFVYYLIVTDEALENFTDCSNGKNQGGISYDFVNKVTYHPWPTETTEEWDDAAYKYEFVATDKGLTNLKQDSDGNYLEDSNGYRTDRAKYSITLNEQGMMIGDEATITATDTFSTNQTVLLSSISVTPAEGVSYVLDNEKHTITFTIPNATPVTITYETIVDGDSEEEKGGIKLTNDIELCGFTNGIGSVPVQKFDGRGGGQVYSVKLYKTDNEDSGKWLGGAEFDLYQGSPKDKNPTKLHHITTVENGCVTLQYWGDNDTFASDTPYFLKETKAPAGYRLSNEPICFMFSSDGHSGTENGVKILTGGRELIIENAPITTSVSGVKTWDDDNNRDGRRPDSITIRLYADGKEIASRTVTEADGWRWKFTNLRKYRNNGRDEIVYTISEDEVEGYTTDVKKPIVTSSDKIFCNVTNSYTPEKVSISGHKIWKDSNNADGSRPRKITVNLLKNGEKIDSQTVTGPDWDFTFDDLPKYEDGKLITYTVTEDRVRGYSTEITGNAEDGFKIINRHTPHRWKHWNPKTGDPLDLLLWFSLMLLSGSGIFTIIALKRRKGKYQR